MLKETTRRHPIIVSLLSFVFVSFPQWASGVWSLFSSDPFFVAIYRHYGSRITAIIRWAPVIVGAIGVIVVLFVVLRRKSDTSKEHVDAPTQRHPHTAGNGPQIVALRYGEKPEFFRGLFIRNDGEPAFNVSIPSIKIGTVLATFSRRGELTNFSKEDGEAYFDLWIEESGNPSRAGALFEAMRENGVESADFAIYYDDFDGHRYTTSATFEVDVLAHGGIVVRHKGRSAVKAVATPQSEKESPPINMSAEWKELAAKFERADRFVRADWARCINLQTNEVVYDQWDIKAGYDNAGVQALCAYAGRLLPKSMQLRDLLTDEIKQESNPAWRWLRFLKHNYRAMDSERFPAHGINEQGQKVERYYLGTINEIATRSATACTDCAGREI